MVDYSLNYQYYASQFVSKLFAVYEKFGSLVTFDDLKRVFMFDYEYEDVEVNERSILRSLISKQFAIFERLTALPYHKHTFNLLMIYCLQINFYSVVLGLEFLQTSISTTAKRFADRRADLDDLDESVHYLRLE